MKVEVHSAADFLINLLRVKQAHSSLPEHVLQRFNQALQTLLVMRFNKHWYPDRPTRGSGYRCIRINGKMDPLVAQAGAASGMAAHTLRKMLPTELTLWIDPDEVAYRIGENGSICVLYDSESARNSPSSEDGGAGTGADCVEFIMERKMRLSVPCAGDASAAFHLVNGVMRGVEDYRTPSPVMMPVSSSSSASSSAASSPPQQQQQHQRQQQHHQRQMGGRPNHNVSPGLNSSVSTDSSSSPPMSPQYAGVGRHFQQQQQQQQQLQHRQQQHQQNVYGVEQRHVYQWSGSEENFSPQLRSQC